MSGEYVRSEEVVIVVSSQAPRQHPLQDDKTMCAVPLPHSDRGQHPLHSDDTM